MRRKSSIAVLLLSAVLALSGCGGSVAVQSGFAAPVVPPAGGAHAGLSVSGGNGLALALVLALIIADGVYWATRSPQADAEELPREKASRPLFQRIDRGWVDRGP